MPKKNSIYGDSANMPGGSTGGVGSAGRIARSKPRAAGTPLARTKAIVKNPTSTNNALGRAINKNPIVKKGGLTQTARQNIRQNKGLPPRQKGKTNDSKAVTIVDRDAYWGKEHLSHLGDPGRPVSYGREKPTVKQKVNSKARAVKSQIKYPTSPNTPLGSAIRNVKATKANLKDPRVQALKKGAGPVKKAKITKATYKATKKDPTGLGRVISEASKSITDLL